MYQILFEAPLLTGVKVFYKSIENFQLNVSFFRCVVPY